MKILCPIAYLCLMLSGLPSCIGQSATKAKINELSKQRTVAEKNDDLKKFLSDYDADAIVMPEYQLTLRGQSEIETYFKEIFQRQKIKSFTRNADEIIELGSTFIEIGSFQKEYTRLTSDSVVAQNGKYWNIWQIQPNSMLTLKGEAYGYFHPVKNEKDLVVALQKTQPDESEILLNKEIPFDLLAYNALMEKGVRIRNGLLRSQFFTPDASIKPYAEKVVSGADQIKPYLIAYSSRGQVTIESVICYTYDFEILDNYILEYDMFKVTWSKENRAGRTEGKGIRIWKRQQDHSLRLFREIGTHNYME